jgi:hypothetical protein
LLILSFLAAIGAVACVLMGVYRCAKAWLTKRGNS